MAEVEKEAQIRADLYDITAIDPLVGSIIANQFEVIGLIGVGGWSKVYKAKQINLNRAIAVKVMHLHLLGNTEKVIRFQREAESLSSLKHPNICTVFDFGVLSSGQPYIAMEFLEGESLASMLRRKEYLQPEEALPIFLSCCEGLLAAHSQGIIHRDIKPANIFVIDQVGQLQAKLVDFGLAKIVNGNTEADLTQSGDSLGTVQYMSPEQALGQQIDLRTDIYSFGCVMYETLTGRQVFTGKTSYQIISQHVRKPPPNLRNVKAAVYLPKSMERIIMKALSKEPKQRYQSMLDLKLHMEQALQGLRNKSQFKEVLCLKAISDIVFFWLITGVVLLIAWTMLETVKANKVPATSTRNNNPLPVRHGKPGIDYDEIMDSSGKKIRHATTYNDDGVIADEYRGEYNPKGKLTKETYTKYSNEGNLQASSEKQYLQRGVEDYTKEYGTDGKVSKAHLSRYNIQGTLVEFILWTYKNDKLSGELDRLLDKNGKVVIKDIIKNYRASGKLQSIKELNYDPTGTILLSSHDIEYNLTGKIIRQMHNKH